MKKHKIILSILLTPFFLPFAEKQSINYAEEEELWSGSVTFLEVRTGPDIVSQEWRMDATYTDNKGRASNKMEKALKPGDKLVCIGAGPSVLEVGIDKETMKYSIMAYVPGCKGKAISAAGREWESNEDETGIAINDQPLDTNKCNVLFGKLVLKDVYADGGMVVTTYTWNLRKKSPPWKNPLTIKSISSLDSRVQAAATRFIQRVNDELCIRLKVAHGLRTPAQQAYIYAQGRTRPGKKVTWALCPESNHCSGLAIDVYIATDNGIDKDAVVPPEVVEIARQEGFTWGGDWKGAKRDPPHFEMKF